MKGWCITNCAKSWKLLSRFIPMENKKFDHRIRYVNQSRELSSQLDSSDINDIEKRVWCHVERRKWTRKGETRKKTLALDYIVSGFRLISHVLLDHWKIRLPFDTDGLDSCEWLPTFENPTAVQTIKTGTKRTKSKQRYSQFDCATLPYHQHLFTFCWWIWLCVCVSVSSTPTLN